MFVSDVATDAVMLVPSKPKLTLLPFENVTALTFEDDAPAEMLMFVSDVATVTVAVSVLPDNPKETLLELLKVIALKFCDVAPAEKLILP